MRSDVVEPVGRRAPLLGEAQTGAEAMLRRGTAGGATAGVLVAAVLGAACGAGPQRVADVAVQGPGAGVIFSYPADGQYDVPARARVLLGFSDALPAAPDPTACATAGNQVTGAFCVEGPDGFVAGTVEVSGSTLAFSPPAGGLAPGVTYKVWARPALLPGATNLRSGAPLLTFRTRSTRIRAGEPATVLTVNGAPLAADGTTSAPLLDAAPVRLVFSEPLDPTSVSTASVRLVRGADATAVEGEVLAHSVHLTFQPAQALAAGERYRLELTDALRDAGGEPIAPVAFVFTPGRMAAPGHDLYKMSMNVAPPWAGAAAQPRSRLGLIPANSNVLESQLVGSNTMGVIAGALDTLAGDPDANGTAAHVVNPLPILIRRGQRLDLSAMSIRFGGEIASGVETGTIHFTMLSDAVGAMLRNPYRDAAQVPDDVQAPTWVDLTMDAVMTSADRTGHVLSTQTVMGIRVLGISGLSGDELAIDQVGAIDYSIQGLETAPVALAMRLQTTKERSPTPDLGAPVLLSSIPASDAVDVSPAEPIELNFSGPLHPGRIRDGVEVTLTPAAQAGGPVPTSTRLEGATLVVVPSRRLEEGTKYTVSFSGLRGLTGAGTAGALSFTTAVTTAPATPPILTALTPGAPCALVGGSAASGGRCAGGKDTDTPYQPFTLPANGDVRAIFSQPIDPATLTLGTACGQGSVRLEQVNAGGQCGGVVSGTLVKRDRELRFLPSAPWTPGAAYRLTLVAGPNATCDAGEICGRNKLPLDSDPLVPGDVAAGGPDVVVGFTGAPATADVYQPQASEPVVDQNGNGLVDASEHQNEDNRVAMELVKFGGIITAASLDGADCIPEDVPEGKGKQVCSYLNGTLPASVGGVLPVCPIDLKGQPSTAPNPCVEVRVFPSLILGTSTSTSTTAIGLLANNNVPTGIHLMRLRETSGPIHGYIMREEGKPPQFVINQEMYLDQPQLKLPLATHDVHSKPIRSTMKGAVTFGADGRMRVALRSLADVSIKVNVDAGFLIGTGFLDLRIPAGQMRTTLVGPPLR